MGKVDMYDVSRLPNKTWDKALPTSYNECMMDQSDNYYPSPLCSNRHASRGLGCIAYFLDVTRHAGLVATSENVSHR